MAKASVGGENSSSSSTDRHLLSNPVQFSSAHVYLRLPPNTTWESIPGKLLDDLSQLVKANSIEGNKRDNITIIYTPWRNVKKTGDMAIGSVMFHNDQKVRTDSRRAV